MNKIRLIVPLLLAAFACGTVARAAGTLKVCADPDYLPYSNRAGQGFENALARYVAKTMGKRLEYVWGDTRGHGGYDQFLATTLDKGRCDLVMSMPYANQEELTTDPYYVSSYVMVFKKNKGYNLHSLNSLIQTNLKIGFESDTPVETGLKLRGLVLKAKPFNVGGTPGESPKTVLEAVQNGTVDVMLTWQPSIGAYLHEFPDLTTVKIPNSRATGSPEMYSFPMSMAVHTGNKALHKQLDALIKKHRDALDHILQQHGVQMVGWDDGSASVSAIAGN